MDFSDPPEKMPLKKLVTNCKDTPWKMLILPESSIPMKSKESLEQKKTNVCAHDI